MNDLNLRPLFLKSFLISSPVITARKRSLRRLCFYTCLSVILFTGGGGVHGCWGACMVAGGTCVVTRGVHVCRGHAWLPGVCAWLQGGMHGCRGAYMVAEGCALLPGGCVVVGGMCGCGGHAWWQGRHAWDTTRCGQ